MLLPPQDWTDILVKLQRGGLAEAVLAGGALRDLEQGKPIKDLDIFIEQRDEHTGPNIQACLGLDDNTLKRMETPENYGIHFTELYGVWEWFRPEPLIPVQIIALNMTVDLNTVVSRFDFGICQVAYDVRCTLHTAAYYKDIAHKTFTVLKDSRTTATRWERLRAKYEGWTLNDPENLLANYITDDGFDFA